MKNIAIDNIRFVSSILCGRRLAVLLLAANLFLLTLYVTGLSSTVLGKFGQQNKKRVEKHKTFLKLPLEVFEAKIGDRPIALGEQFDGDLDWLKGLKIKVKNKSDKTITWASIFFIFPETRLIGPVMMDQLFIGQRSDISPKNPPLDLKPGEEMELPLESHFNSIKQLIESHSRLDLVNDVDIEVHEVMFADGTLYSGGSMWKPNPDTASPHKWVEIAPKVDKP
ncbi:MAG TPA: hypothetical protein VN956_21030 [Pyrinomonadaceae bacterium]|nr:hypothetical protein [Pyrinomonadaceae bacterium]